MGTHCKFGVTMLYEAQGPSQCTSSDKNKDVKKVMILRPQQK
jgi:hypothetical protein